MKNKEVIYSENRAIRPPHPAHLSIFATFDEQDESGVIRVMLPPIPESLRVHDFEATQYVGETSRLELVTEAMQIFNTLFEKMTQPGRAQAHE